MINIISNKNKFELKNLIIEALKESNLHTQPSRETLRLIADLQSNDEVFKEKIDNFILESRNDQAKIYDEVKKINGSIQETIQWRERIKGNIDMLKILFLPVILSIIFLYLEKFLG